MLLHSGRVPFLGTSPGSSPSLTYILYFDRIVSPMPHGSTLLPHENRRSSQVIIKTDLYQVSTHFFSFLEFILASFASMSNTDSEQIRAKERQNFQAEPSTYASSPCTSRFGPDRDDQPNGTEQKMLPHNWQIDGAEQENTKRTDTSSFDSTKTSLKRHPLDYFIHLYILFTRFLRHEKLNNKTFKTETFTLFEALPVGIHIPPTKTFRSFLSPCH